MYTQNDYVNVLNNDKNIKINMNEISSVEMSSAQNLRNRRETLRVLDHRHTPSK